MLGAFDISSNLFLQIKFASTTQSNNLAQLEYSFYDPSGVKQWSSMTSTPWNMGEELIDMVKLRKKLSPGVWSVQVSCHGQTVASSKFVVLTPQSL